MWKSKNTYVLKGTRLDEKLWVSVDGGEKSKDSAWAIQYLEAQQTRLKRNGWEDGKFQNAVNLDTYSKIISKEGVKICYQMLLS